MNDIEKLRDRAKLWSRLRLEQDGTQEQDLAAMSESELTRLIERLENSENKSADEPNDLAGILALCDMPEKLGAPTNIEKRMLGAVAGRFAGCTLGVPVEGYSIDRMKSIAEAGGTPFPPTEYWHTVENPDGIQYGVDKRSSYALGGIKYVPVDDDITYPVLNMLALKKYGAKYTVSDMAQLWLDILPYACTAEDETMKMLKAGVTADHAAEGNPFVEWIGAAIRADAFGYACAGDPAAAALLSYNDAFLTHRRNGIYGEMYTAALIAAAFCVPPLEAVEVAKRCIPRNCRLRRDIDWALAQKGKVTDYRAARALIDGRFPGMDNVHIENNVCAVIFALMLGEGDFTKAIAQSVAMGLDNDCNAATVGSVMGAWLGIDGVDKKWYEPFDNTVRTYLTGYETVKLDYIVDSFVELYKKIGKEQKA